MGATTLSITTFSITTLGIMGENVTPGMNNNEQNVVIQAKIFPAMLSIIKLNVTFFITVVIIIILDVITLNECQLC
jgi:hypothetical protein